jgi:molybdopterin synthase catalytic subunit
MTEAIRVRVRLFAVQRELVGQREVALDLAAPATIEDAWSALVALYPVLAPGRPAIRFARNAAYAPAAERLSDGDEVAMIPPVSGGAEAGEDAGDGGRRAPSGPLRIIELREEAFGPAILAELATRLLVPADGAVVGFLGVTRESPGTPAPGQEVAASIHRDRTVDALEYEAHPEMARDVIAGIADEISARYEVDRLAIVHRVGRVPLGQPSIAIVACAPHRDAAFEAARYAIDETKARAPIWKAEYFEDGHVWIGEPPRDAPQ